VAESILLVPATEETDAGVVGVSKAKV
jgi:hypothetical protein